MTSVKSVARQDTEELNAETVVSEDNGELLEGENNDATRDYAEAEFDKQLMALASGALVLTIGFVKDIVTITAATHKWPLLISWVLFSLTLVINLLSHLVTVKAIDQRTLGRRASSDKWNTCVKVMNYTAVGSFIAGISFFIAFVFMNINNKPIIETTASTTRIAKPQIAQAQKAATLPIQLQPVIPAKYEKPIKAQANKN